MGTTTFEPLLLNFFLFRNSLTQLKKERQKASGKMAANRSGLALQITGFLLSVSKSTRKSEDDMLLSSFSLGKVIQNGGKTEKLWPASSLENKIGDEQEDGASKFSNIGSKHHVISHGQPLKLAIMQHPYFALKGPIALPDDAEIESNESTQERRETGDDEDSAILPIGRRDFDMLRCMLGRVYRPCWQA
uniref:Pro-MCH n=1 Tax=Pogona vitticeps TaxID=103695 RepID=A0ABM5GEN6_9SAUR